MTTGTIAGDVTDSLGEPLPGVVVTAASPSTLGERTAVTRANGGFLLRGLPLGQYQLTATMTGFKTMNDTIVIVHPEKVTRVDLVMVPASIEEGL